MSSHAPSYHGCRFPPAIISHAVWLYHRFCLSVRDAEDLLVQRGVTVSYETIRQWCLMFGPAYTRSLRRRHGRLGDTWYLDELFVNIQGRQQYLWRVVDEDGDMLDMLVQSRRNRRAGGRFFRKVWKGQGRVPRRRITDQLRSYPAAARTVMPSVVHAWRGAESLSGGAASLEVGPPPPPSHTGVRRMGAGDVCLLKGRSGLGFAGKNRATWLN